MKIREIADILSAAFLTEDDPDIDIRSACGSDMMSDVLAFVKDRTVLVTGLTNAHVIRTAEMLDVSCIVFCRGKKPDEDMLKMARERGIVILCTAHTMYVACGLLYTNGIVGCESGNGR